MSQLHHILLTGTLLMAMQPLPAMAAEPAAIVADQLAGMPAAAQARLVGWPADVRDVAPALQSLQRFASPADRMTLERLLGHAAEQRFAAAEALSHYRAALAGGAAGIDRGAVLLGIARVESWSDRAAARRTLDLLDDLPAAAAAAGQLRARMALADGDAATARALRDAALAALDRLPPADADAMRRALAADAATIIALSGSLRETAAAAAAAGMVKLRDNAALLASTPIMPACSTDGARPDDDAIFDVAVGPVSPTRVTLVRASRPAAVAPLGTALAAWQWPPATRKDPPVRQGGFHIRIACSAIGAPPMPSLGEIWPQPFDWFVARGIALPRDDANVPGLRAGLAKAATPAERLPWLLQMAVDASINRRETLQLLDRALADSRAADAPFAFTGIALLLRANLVAPTDAIRMMGGLIAAVPAGENTRAMADWARLQLADLHLATDGTAEALATLQAVAEQPAGDPASQTEQLRRIAAHRLAWAGDTGDTVSTARRAAAGLPAGACRTGPLAPVGVVLKAFAYPAEAKPFLPQGWVRVSLDIDAGGAVTAARVIEAAPPVLFEAAALEAVRGYRFQPGAGLPCRDQAVLINQPR